MLANENTQLKNVFWFIICTLLFIPIGHSFFINIKNVSTTIVANNEYKELLCKLNDENTKLNNKVNYYNTQEGIKALVKDRLNKVENGELIIKFKEKNKT